MHSSSLSDLKKTTGVVESSSKTSTRCSVHEDYSQLQDYINRMRNLHQMVLIDFLSRQNNDNSKPHEIIPISFNMHQVLHKNYYNTENYLAQTRFQARSSAIKH